MEDKNTKDKSPDIRSRAEKIFQDRQADYPDPSEMSPEETQRLIRELRLRQIELEIQNEDLSRPQSELKTKLDRYYDLEGFVSRVQKMALMGTWEWDISSGRRIWSDELYRILGYEPQSVPPSEEAIMERIHPDDREYVANIVRGFTDGGRTDETFEHRILHPDGTEHFVRGRWWLQQDKDGRPVRWFGTMFDITSRVTEETLPELIRSCVENIHECMRTEAALRESETLLCEAQHIGKLGHWAWNTDTDTLTWSDEVYRIFGIQPGSLQPSVEAFEAAIHPDDLEEFLSKREKMLNQQEDAYMEHRIILPDGNIRYVAERAGLKSDDKGNVKLVIGTIQDTTWRWQAEEALRESEKKYRILFNTSPIGLVLCRMNGEVADVNPAYAGILGRSVEETLDLSYWDITPPKYADQEQEQLESLRTVGRYGPYEKEYIHKDGHLVPVRLMGQQVEQDGEQLIWSFVEDISERRQAQESLRKSEERYRAFFENVRIGIAVYEPVSDGDEFIFRDMNRAGEKLSLARHGEIVGRKLTEVFPGVKEFGLFEVLQRVNKTGEPEFLDANIYEDENRPPIWFENSVFKLPSGEIIAAYNNVSKRMKAMKALEDSERKYKNLVENSLTAVIQTSLDGRILFANQKAAEFLGYEDTREFVSECDPSKIYIGGQRFEMIEKLRQDGFFTNREQQFVTKSGGSVWTLFSSFLDRETDVITSFAMDITDWKKTEKEKERLLNIIENAPYFVGLADGEGKVQYINPAGRKMAGVTGNDDFVGKPVGLFHSERGYSLVKNTGIPHAMKEGFWEGETEIVSYDGRIIPAVQTIIVHYDEHGNLEYMSTTIRDISDMKNEMREHEETRLFLDRVIEQSPMATWIADDRGTCIQTNKALRDLMNVRDEDMIGRYNVFEDNIMQSQGLVPTVRKAYEGETVNYQCEWNGRDFKCFDLGESGNVKLDVTMYPIFDTSGKLVNVVTQQIDITETDKVNRERLKAEQALMKSLRLTSEIMEHSPIGISVYDASGQCIAANDAIADMVGASKSQVLSQNWLQIKSWQDTGMTDVLKRSLEQNSKGRFEFHGKSSFGKPITLDCHFSPISEGRFLMMGIDIAEIREKEQELRCTTAELNEHRQNLEKLVEQRTDDLRAANAELELASRLKDEFLANMSHELRTPLTAVLGMSEALLEQVYGPLNEKQISSLQRIESSGEHLLNLINDILDLSEISAGRAELRIDRVSVDAVCQASLKMIKGMAHKKKQRISVITDSGVTHIRADMLRVKQMLVNLLTNAVKFTPERGKIALEVNGIPGQDMVEFAVRDTGMGISREDMKKLFKPFVQLDGGLSREHEGTGLGLVMVSRLAEMHGGSVKVESEEGRYSRFAIMLPWHPGEDLRGFENLAGLDKNENSGGLARILMADDNMANIETVADYLRAKSYSVLLAYDGSEAVALTIEKKPELIIMDIQMPVMDGLEAIKAIRKREKEEDSGTRRVPVIALTALAMPGDREKCIEAGADEYMSKPVELKKLAATIETLIRG